MLDFTIDKQYALTQDHRDELAHLRQLFSIPKHVNGQDVHYFSGNSLGLKPHKANQYVNEELNKWGNLGVEGHINATNPWLSYHELVTDMMAEIVGAKPCEVVMMNSLTVNLHLLFVSFYQPTATRFKILINPHLFSSDYYAICSQIKCHGLNPEDVLLVLPASPDGVVAENVIDDFLDEHGSSIALVWMEALNYYTGQAYNINKVSNKAHEKGCLIGWDLAHAVGNCELYLHRDQVDFAVWCSYKYLNSGPGSIGGCFVHQSHHEAHFNRFAGWWGHHKQKRFLMDTKFHPIVGAEGWQVSNPPILSLACLRASLEIFSKVGIKKLRAKSIRLTNYLEFLIEHLQHPQFKIITPKSLHERGCQLSVAVTGDAQGLQQRLLNQGFVCDLRHPNILRFAPTPLYNSYGDVFCLFVYLQKEELVVNER